MVFHWSSSDCKSPQVSRTPGILTDLNNAVVWTVSTRPVISKSSRPCTNPLVTVPRAPITIDIIDTFSFFSSLVRSRYSSPFRFLSILLCGSLEQQRPQFCRFSIFCWLLLGLVVWSRLGDLLVCQNPRRVCASHSPGLIMGCAYTI